MRSSVSLCLSALHRDSMRRAGFCKRAGVGEHLGLVSVLKGIHFDRGGKHRQLRAQMMVAGGPGKVRATISVHSLRNGAPSGILAAIMPLWGPKKFCASIRLQSCAPSASGSWNKGTENSQDMGAVVHDHRPIIWNRVKIRAEGPDRFRVKEHALSQTRSAPGDDASTSAIIFSSRFVRIFLFDREIDNVASRPN